MDLVVLLVCLAGLKHQTFPVTRAKTQLAVEWFQNTLVVSIYKVRIQTGLMVLSFGDLISI